LNKDKQVAQKDQNKEADGDVNNKTQKEQRKTGIEWRVVTKKPEIVNLEAFTSKKSKEDVELKNEINDVIERHNATFAHKETYDLTNKLQRQEAAQQLSSEIEFVENTLNHDETESPLKSIDSVPSKVEIAQKDVYFLRDSWANLEATKVPQARLLVD